MMEAKLRQQFVDTARSFYGAETGDPRHRER